MNEHFNILTLHTSLKYLRTRKKGENHILHILHRIVLHKSCTIHQIIIECASRMQKPGQFHAQVNPQSWPSQVRLKLIYAGISLFIHQTSTDMSGGNIAQETCAPTRMKHLDDWLGFPSMPMCAQIRALPERCVLAREWRTELYPRRHRTANLRTSKTRKK